MRPGNRSRLRELAVIALAASIGGCSTTGSDEPLATSSLAPRPAEGLRQDPPRYNTAESESPKPYTQPFNQPAAYQPPPRQYAQQQPRYDTRYPQQQYAPQTYAAAQYPPPAPYQPAQPYAPRAPYGREAPYAQPTPAAQAPQGYAQAPQAYPPQAAPQQAGYGPTWQQRQTVAHQGHGQGQIQTGSLGRTAPNAYGAPAVTGSLTNSATTIQVREGDTLYGLSRRTGVPVAELVAANRLPSQRIEVGQKLIIPARVAR